MWSPSPLRETASNVSKLAWSRERINVQGKNGQDDSVPVLPSPLQQLHSPL